MSGTQLLPPKRNRWMFWKKGEAAGKENVKDESFYRAGQWQLVWWKFRRHKLAQIAMVVLGIFYIIVIFAEFIAPYAPEKRFQEYSTLPPVNVRMIDAEGKFHLPFVYALVRARDPVTLRPIYKEDTTAERYPVVLFARGDEYKMWGLLPGNIHLFGSGYPIGLKGEEIPLFARIFAVADVFDALTSKRSYRKRSTPDQALDYLREHSNLLFDPQIVEALAALPYAEFTEPEVAAA